MVALADVRRWDAAALNQIFTAMGAARNRLQGVDDAAQATRPSTDVWQGAAADASNAWHDVAAGGLQQLRDGLSAARPMVAAAADELAALKADLADADALAATYGFAIAPDATVTDVRATVVAADQVEAYRAARGIDQAHIVDMLHQVMTRAAALDTSLRDTVTQVTDSHIDPATIATARSAPDLNVVPVWAEPAQVAAWWKRLTPDERNQLLATHPDQLGNLDGLPGAVRDTANRTLLPEQLSRIDAALAAAQASLAAAHAQAILRRAGRDVSGVDPEVVRLSRSIARLQQQHDALVAVQSVINGPQRQLLLLDIDSHALARAAVGVGDVDTADHVAVFTPGFTTTVAGGLAPTVNDLVALRQTADRRIAQVPDRSGQTVAAVAWIGYDVPQWDTVIDPADSVLSDAAAQRGGIDLARFDDGLLASRTEHRPHFTALGHSYGSTTTGYALTHTTQPVDDAVVFGSPGLGTDNAAALHVAPGHLDVIAAPGDPVAASGIYGGRPSSLPGVVMQPAWPATTGDGTPLAGSFGHSAYLVPRTTSQYEIASTVAGLPDPTVRPHLPPTGPRPQ